MPKNKLTARSKGEKDLLLKYYTKLGECYRFKQLFMEFWELKNKQEADAYLTFRCDAVEDCRIQPFIKVANTIEAYWTDIENYIEIRLNI